MTALSQITTDSPSVKQKCFFCCLGFRGILPSRKMEAFFVQCRRTSFSVQEAWWVELDWAFRWNLRCWYKHIRLCIVDAFVFAWLVSVVQHIMMCSHMPFSLLPIVVVRICVSCYNVCENVLNEGSYSEAASSPPGCLQPHRNTSHNNENITIRFEIPPKRMKMDLVT